MTKMRRSVKHENFEMGISKNQTKYGIKQGPRNLESPRVLQNRTDGIREKNSRFTFRSEKLLNKTSTRIVENF